MSALRAVRASRPPWSESLLEPRRVLVTALLLPLTLWAARTSLPAGLRPGPDWWVVIATVALLTAATLASYVPLRRGPLSAGRPCAGAAVVFVVLSLLMLGSASASVVTAVPALLLAAAGLGQRLVGAATCRPVAR